MKWLCSAVTFLACAALVAAGEARLVCDDPQFDFGMLANTQTVRHTYQLRNAGDAAARIAGVRTTCGCTSAVIVRNTIEPGESGSVDVALDLHGRRGPQNRPVYVNWNSPNGQPLRLAITGVAASGIVVEPPSITFDGPASTGVVERTVRLAAPGTNSFFQITGVSIRDSRFAVRVETNALGSDYRLVFSALASSFKSSAATMATVTTDNPERMIIKVPIFVRVRQVDRTEEAMGRVGGY